MHLSHPLLVHLQAVPGSCLLQQCGSGHSPGVKPLGLSFHVYWCKYLRDEFLDMELLD